VLLEMLLLTQLAAPPALKRLPRTPTKPPPAAAQKVPTTRIDLVVKTSTGETRASVLPGKAQPEPRPIATIRAGEKPQIRYLVQNLSATQPVKDIVVHLLVLREEAAGEPIPAGARKGTVLDTVMGTNLAAKRGTSGNYNTAIHQPGNYLVELELLDPQGNRRQYCALELKVE
jgi:hypothetical protein